MFDILLRAAKNWWKHFDALQFENKIFIVGQNGEHSSTFMKFYV